MTFANNRLTINKVVFIKNHAWYLSIANINGNKGCYWSCHNRAGLSDKEAKQAFAKAHFAEVQELIKQQLNLS